MKFREWLMNEGFGNFKYKFPDDKRQQLYDFYMIQQLMTLDPLDNVRSSTGVIGLQPSLAGGESQGSREEQINYVVKETSKIILDSIQKELLDALYYSVCCEMRHIKYTNYREVLQSSVFKADEFEKLKIFNDKARDTSSYNNFREIRTLAKRDDIKKYFVGRGIEDQIDDDIERVRAFIAAKDSFGQLEFMKLAEKAFRVLSWASGYGGPAWAKIANSWLQLQSAGNDQQRFVQIDHIYDLEHNSGSVFNKIKAYARKANNLVGESYQWIKEALDHKARITEPHELMQFVSPSMHILAAAALFSKTGKAVDKYNSEKDDRIATQIKNAPSAFRESLQAISNKKGLYEWFTRNPFTSGTSWLSSNDPRFKFARGVVAMAGENFVTVSNQDLKTVALILNMLGFYSNYTLQTAFWDEWKYYKYLSENFREGASPEALKDIEAYNNDGDSAIQFNLGVGLGVQNNNTALDIQSVLGHEFGLTNIRKQFAASNEANVRQMLVTSFPTAEWRKYVFNFLLADYRMWLKLHTNSP